VIARFALRDGATNFDNHSASLVAQAMGHVWIVTRYPWHSSNWVWQDAGRTPLRRE